MSPRTRLPLLFGADVLPSALATTTSSSSSSSSPSSLSSLPLPTDRFAHAGPKQTQTPPDVVAVATTDRNLNVDIGVGVNFNRNVSGPPILDVIGILLVLAVGILAMMLLSWFCRRCYSYGYGDIVSLGRNGNDNDNGNGNDNSLRNDRALLRTIPHGSEHEPTNNNNNNNSDWDPSIPSHIAIPSGNRYSNSNTVVPTTPRKGIVGDRRPRRNRNAFFRFRTGREDGEDDDEDETALTTSTCYSDSDSDSSLPDAEAAAAAAAATTASTIPFGLRPEQPQAQAQLQRAESESEDYFPHATIQFRIPINGSFDPPRRNRNCNRGIPNGSYYNNYYNNNNNNNNNDDDETQHENSHNNNDEEEINIDLLRDFLSHTEDYVSYPRSRLTILLRARAPSTPAAAEELSRLRAIVEDAASLSASASLASVSSGRRRGGRRQRQRQHPPPPQQQQQQQEQTQEPLQVCVVPTLCGDDDLLRCAPSGGVLVTFGSVRELPRGHPDFLRDLIV